MFTTRAQWEGSFIIHGKAAKEVSAEEIREQIELWRAIPLFC